MDLTSTAGGCRPVHRARARWLALLAFVSVATLATDAAGVAPRPRGTVRVAGRPAANVVVWLEAPDARPTEPARVVLDQRNLRFAPKVLAVRVGTEVLFPNNDRVFHNVFSFHHGKVFDLGLYPVGDSKAVRFDKPGLSRIFCNIHPNMAAYVVAVDSPYFAVTDETGAFELPPVPAGRYTYRAWRSSSPEQSGVWTIGSASDSAELSIEWQK
jgi:plastocyanin